MIDGGLWAYLKPRLTRGEWTRIESGSTSRGIPDAVGTYVGRTAWLELKNGLYIGRREWWSKWQRAWAYKNVQYGWARIFVVARRVKILYVWDVSNMQRHGVDLTEVKLTWDNGTPVSVAGLEEIIWR